MNNDTTVISRKRLKHLEEAERTLSALMAAGVDNWEGYSMAFEDLEDEED